MKKHNAGLRPILLAGSLLATGMTPTLATAASTDLRVVLQPVPASTTTATFSEPVQYRFAVINYGPGTATNLTLRGKFSGGSPGQDLMFIQTTPSICKTASDDPNVFECTIPSMAPNTPPFVLDPPFTIWPAVAGQFVTAMEVMPGATDTDPNLTNNQSSVAVTVPTPPTGNLALTVNKKMFPKKKRAKITLIVQNKDRKPAERVKLMASWDGTLTLVDAVPKLSTKDRLGTQCVTFGAKNVMYCDLATLPGKKRRKVSVLLSAAKSGKMNIVSQTFGMVGETKTRDNKRTLTLKVK